MLYTSWTLPSIVDETLHAIKNASSAINNTIHNYYQARPSRTCMTMVLTASLTKWMLNEEHSRNGISNL